MRTCSKSYSLSIAHGDGGNITFIQPTSPLPCFFQDQGTFIPPVIQTSPALAAGSLVEITFGALPTGAVIAFSGGFWRITVPPGTAPGGTYNFQIHVKRSPTSEAWKTFSWFVIPVPFFVSNNLVSYLQANGFPSTSGIIQGDGFGNYADSGDPTAIFYTNTLGVNSVSPSLYDSPDSIANGGCVIGEYSIDPLSGYPTPVQITG